MIQNTNIGDLVKIARAGANIAATAGGSGDDTEVTGVIIDRLAIGTPSSAVLAISFTATLAQGETLTVDYAVQQGAAANLSDAEALTTGSVVAATGGTGGTTETGCVEIDLNVIAGGQYLRADITPNLSASGTDTAALASLLVFGGMDRVPQ